jgi:hypothetical protein
MAFKEKTPYEENLDILQGRAPPQADSQIGLGAGAAVSPDGAQGGEPGISTTPTPQPVERPSSFGGVSGDIFGGIERQLGSTGGELRGAVSEFQRGAGPSRTFDTSGAKDTLSRTIFSQVPTAEDIEKSRGFLSARYGGPTGLDAGRVQNLLKGVGELEDVGGALGERLPFFLQTTVPGLSPGSARFEAQQLRGDPGFQSQAEDYRTKIGRLSALFGQEQAQASDFAQKRAGEETEIATKSRGFLTGERSKIEEDLARAVKTQKDRESQVQAGYQQFQETPTLETLKGLNPDFLDFDPEALNTPAVKAQAASQTSLQSIMDQYPDLKEIPTLGLGVHKHGLEMAQLSPEIRAAIAGKPDAERRLFERQQSLEAAGFRPSAAAFEKDPLSPALFNPLYFGPGAQLPEVKNYLSYDPGVSPARENLATEDQRRIFNQIQSLLDEVDRLEEAGEPFRAAKIAADVGTYLEDEDRALSEARGSLSGNAAEWARYVRKARKRYKRMKKTQKWAKVAHVINLVGLSLLGPVGPALASSYEGERQSRGKKSFARSTEEKEGRVLAKFLG